MRKVGEGPPAVGRPDVEELGDPRREALDPALPVEKEGRDVRRGEEVLQVAGELREFFDLVPVFLVDRHEFLVDRPQLLLARLELLRRRTQFLVHRLQFLVRGLHLLARGLVLFDDVLQLPFGRL